MPTHIRRFVPFLLIAIGAVLVFLGARDYFESKWGQHQAAREWENAPPTAGEKPAPPDLGTAMAKLSVPRLSSAWFVVEGIGHKELRIGPGHMPGTALPGTPGNCVIAGHRDTHFRVLKDIKKGDELLVETRQGEFRYRVRNISIVKPTNTKALQPTSEGVINLITCYPFYYVGSAPKRFIVEAELEGRQKAESSQTNRRPS